MKLKKAILYKSVADSLEVRGYKSFKDSTTGADVLFVKRVGTSFFLSLGIVISNLYDARFTASFYLSKTTRWGSLWDDIPKESYKRVGEFLSESERKRLLDFEHSSEGVVDAWWGATDKEVENFIEVIDITEQRFLQQHGLFERIEESREVKELATLSSLVLLEIDRNTINGGSYEFTPRKNIDSIDLKWFKAAEIAIKATKGILNKNTVMLLAADAWRQWNLLSRA